MIALHNTKDQKTGMFLVFWSFMNGAMAAAHYGWLNLLF